MQATDKTKTWTKPEMVRIGRIGDVSGPPTANNLQGPGCSSPGSPSCKS